MTTEFHPSDDMAAEYAERIDDVVGNPVAVQVVDAAPLRVRHQPRRMFTTGQVTVTPGNTPLMLIGANAFRERLLIHSQAGGIYVGPDRDSLTATMGLYLAPNSQMELTTRREVYVIADSATTSPTFLAEHVDG